MVLLHFNYSANINYANGEGALRCRRFIEISTRPCQIYIALPCRPGSQSYHNYLLMRMMRMRKQETPSQRFRVLWDHHGKNAQSSYATCFCVLLINHQPTRCWIGLGIVNSLILRTRRYQPRHTSPRRCKSPCHLLHWTCVFTIPHRASRRGMELALSWCVTTVQGSLGSPSHALPRKSLR